ncbi:MAG: hypothetical protein WD100_11035, partial [Tistlia sp.]
MTARLRGGFGRRALSLGVAAAALLAVQLPAAAQNLGPGSVYVDPGVLNQLGPAGPAPYGQAPYAQSPYAQSPYSQVPYGAPPGAGYYPGQQPAPNAPYPSQPSPFPQPTGPLLFPPQQAPSSEFIAQAPAYGGYPSPGQGALPQLPYGAQPYGAQPYGAQPYGAPAGPYQSVRPTPQIAPPVIARAPQPPAPPVASQRQSQV